MTTALHYLADLAGLRIVKEDGTELPVSGVLNFGAGITASYNPSTGEIDVVGAGAAGSSTDNNKQVCRLATTTNDSLSGLAARDGVTPVGGDRAFVWKQTDGTQNGIYVTAAGAWTRAADFDASADITPGLIVTVSEGTAHGDEAFILETNAPITLGTTALTFRNLRDVPSGHTLAFKGADGLITYPSAGQLKILEGATTVLTVRDNELRIGDLHAAGTNYTIGYDNVPTTENGRHLVIQAQSINHATLTAGTTYVRGGVNAGAGADGGVEIWVAGIPVAEFDTTSSEILTPSGLNALEITDSAISLHLSTLNVGDGTDDELFTMQCTAGSSIGGTILIRGGTGPIGGSAFLVAGDGSTTDGTTGFLYGDLAGGMLIGTDQSLFANHKSGKALQIEVAGNPYLRFEETGSGAIAASGTMRVRNTFHLVRRNGANTDDQSLISNPGSDVLQIGEDTTGGNITIRSPSGTVHRHFIGGTQFLELSSTLLDVDVAAISVGTNPAAAGTIRVPHSASQFVSRNAANTQDITWLGLDGSNNGQIGEDTDIGALQYRTSSGGFHQFLVNNVSVVLIDSTSLRIGTNPASGGTIRLPHNTSQIVSRNTANDGNCTLIWMPGGTNDLAIGEDTNVSNLQLRTASGGALTARFGGTTEYTFSATKLLYASGNYQDFGGEIDIRRQDSTTHRILSTANGFQFHTVTEFSVRNNSGTAPSISIVDSSGTQVTITEDLFSFGNFNATDKIIQCDNSGGTAPGRNLIIRSGAASGTDQAGSLLRIRSGAATGTGGKGAVIIETPGGGALFTAQEDTKISVFGVTAVSRAAAYTVTNLTTDRSYDANATTLDEIADVLGTLISDLRNYGWVQ